jgi:hypothetical protein
MLNQVMEEVEDIKDDPEAWAVEVEEAPKDPKNEELTRDFSSPRPRKDT